MREGKGRGLFLVIVGPDGSGKSTVSALLQEGLATSFSGLWRFHWRPGLLPALNRLRRAGNAGPPPGDIPERAEYSPTASLLRFLYYLADFVLGYWLRVFPRRLRGQLVIGERYFPDVLVHPERYGFALDPRLMRRFAWLIPSPDLIVLLKDTPERIFARKQELSRDHIEMQIAAYEQVIGGWGRSLVVDTAGGAVETADRLAAVVLATSRGAGGGE